MLPSLKGTNVYILIYSLAETIPTILRKLCFKGKKHVTIVIKNVRRHFTLWKNIVVTIFHEKIITIYCNVKNVLHYYATFCWDVIFWQYMFIF